MSEKEIEMSLNLLDSGVIHLTDVMIAAGISFEVPPDISMADHLHAAGDILSATTAASHITTPGTVEVDLSIEVRSTKMSRVGEDSMAATHQIPDMG